MPTIGLVQASDHGLLSIPGQVNGSGTYFEITDSDYLNVALESTESIGVYLSSMPKVVSIVIQSSAAPFAQLTLTGLVPDKTYFKYNNSFHNEATFVADSAGKHIFTQDLSQAHHIWIQETQGTLFIPADCDTVGTFDSSTNTCVLNQNLSDNIEITADNITLDCNGHMLSNGFRWTSFAIYLNNRQNVTVKNCTIGNATNGIAAVFSDNNTFVNNGTKGNSVGILLSSSDFNTVSNIASIANGQGIQLNSFSQNNTLANNTISDLLFGIILNQSRLNRIEGNAITNSRSTGINISALSHSNNILNNIVASNYFGILITQSDRNSVRGNQVISNSSGIVIGFLSFNNTATDNTIESNQLGLLFAFDTDINRIFHNNFINNAIQAAVSREPNLFDNALPDGGNFWDNYDTLAEGCNDANNDKFCDMPFIINSALGARDNFPWTVRDGWENQPPVLSNPNQYESDGATLISEGQITTEPTIVFKAILNDPDNDQIKLQIELKEFSQQFDGIDLTESGFVSSGQQVAITQSGLIKGQYHWRARAVDSRGDISDWQEFGAAGNIDFEVTLVPLYTQVVSPYPSQIETESWFDKPYAKGVLGNYDCGSSIADCGCAITSMVMLVRYYDIDTAVDDSNADPGNINSWLTANGGYTSNGSLWWGKAVEYLGFIDQTTGKKMVRLNHDFYNASTSIPWQMEKINNYVNAAKPVIAYSKKFGHYFIIDNKLVATYGVKDPRWYNTRTLDDVENLSNKVRDYDNYFNTANLFSYLTTPKPITASIFLALSSPAELLVIDPLGRKLGKDPVVGTSYNEIPDGVYTKEGQIVTSDIPLDPGQIKESKIISIPSPIDGEYHIQIIGTDIGSYIADLLVYDQIGQSKNAAVKGEITANNVQELDLTYSAETIEQTELSRIVDIDIKPGSFPNSINLKSKGLTPIAVLTDQFFNAKDIVVDSVIFAGVNPKKGKPEDIDNDGDLDLILHFDTRLLQLEPASTEGILTGQLTNGTLIKGRDSVRIIQEPTKQTIILRLLSFISQFIQSLFAAIGLAPSQ